MSKSINACISRECPQVLTEYLLNLVPLISKGNLPEYEHKVLTPGAVLTKLSIHM